MSEPLWFLDTSNETDQKSQENGSPKPAELKFEPEKGSQKYSTISEESKEKEKISHNDWTDNKVSSGEDNVQSFLLDEANLKSELENSLFDIAKDSIKKGQNPEIRITINTDDFKLDSEEEEKSFLVDDSISNNQDVYDKSYPKDEMPKIKVKLNVSKDGKTVGEEKEFEIDSSLIQQDTFNDENKSKPYKPKIFVVVSSNKERKSAEFEKELNSQGSDNQYCTEIGSAVIKLNDFITTETEEKSDEKIIVTSNLNNSLENGEKKVELVITIKDKRKKITEPEQNSITPEFIEEQNFQKPQFSESITKRNFESELKNIQDRIQQLSNTVNANSSTQNWDTTAYRKYSENNDVSSETRDTFVREHDGARCYRTVWNSPEGRRVETQCYSDGRRPTRQRKSFGRARNYDWYPSVGSLWREMDNEFDRIFAHVDRFMYF